MKPRKDASDTGDLRAKAIDATATWRADLAAAESARSAFDTARSVAESERRPGYPIPPTTRLDLIVLEMRVQECDDACRASEALARQAVGAAEIAEGLTDSIACDVASLAGDLAAMQVEREALRQRLADTDVRTMQRVQSARDARDRLSAARATAGLPDCAWIPFPEYPQTLIDALAESIASPAVQQNDRLVQLQRDERALRAELEAARIAAELQAAADEVFATSRDEYYRSEAAADLARGLEAIVAARASFDAETALADAHRARGR